MNNCDDCGELVRDDLDYCPNCKKHLFDGEKDLRRDEDE